MNWKRTFSTTPLFSDQGVIYLNPYVDDVGCFSRFFIAKCDENQELNYSFDEVESINLFTIDEIVKMLDENPTMFKPDYVVAFTKFVSKIYNGQLDL